MAYSEISKRGIIDTLTSRAVSTVGVTDDLTGIPAIGSLFGTDTGKYGRVCVSRQIRDSDVWGIALVYCSYRTLTPQEWLIRNPGKAMLLIGGGGFSKGYSKHDSGEPVEGYNPAVGGINAPYYRKTDGNPSELCNGCTFTITGYCTTASTPSYSTLFQLAGRKYSVASNVFSNIPGMDTDGTAFGAASNLILATASLRPLATLSQTYDFSFTFVLNNVDAACISWAFQRAVASQDRADDAAKEAVIQYWRTAQAPVVAGPFTTNNYLSTDFTAVNDTLTGGY